MSSENRRLTVAKADLLDGGSDARFRDLLYDFFAFGGRTVDFSLRLCYNRLKNSGKETEPCDSAPMKTA